MVSLMMAGAAYAQVGVVPQVSAQQVSGQQVSTQQVSAQQGTAALQGGVAPQEPRPYKLQVTSQNVVLDVVVNDTDRRNVKGLTKDDFQIFEEKKPQTIMAFEEVVGKAGVAPVAVNSTAELDRLEPEAPVSILVIDELTTKFEDLAFARYSLKKYLKAQGDTLVEPTMLISANFKNIAVLRDYTTSRKEILDALDHHLANYSALFTAQNPSWQGEQINAAFGSLMGVAEATAGHRGHKNMVWIGRGFPPVNLADMLSTDRAAFDSALGVCTRMLRDSRVTLYAVNPAGISVQPPAHDENGMDLDDPFGGQVDFDTIAVATGGKALHGRNDVDHMIDESVRDGENFYTISYRPTEKSDDPKSFRKIRVVMKNPGLRASTREGYFVGASPVAPMQDAKGTFSQQLLFDLGLASASMLVYDAVPVTVMRDAMAQDNFTLHLKAADLPLEVDASQKPSAEITVVTLSYDRKGKMLDHSARLMTVRMNSRPPADGPDRRSVAIPVTISTKAPAARLRFIVRTNANGKLGAENYFLVDRKMIADPASGADVRKKY
jgi:VWFA-related protein